MSSPSLSGNALGKCKRIRLARQRPARETPGAVWQGSTVADWSSEVSPETVYFRVVL
jgi:hypothetical protein